MNKWLRHLFILYSAILIMANRFFESQPTAGFQKNDFGISSAAGAGNTKIVFIMRIAVWYYWKLKHAIATKKESQNTSFFFGMLRALIAATYCLIPLYSLI